MIDEARKKQMAAPGLQEPAKKALATLDREWDGLAAHRDYPMMASIIIPMTRLCRCPRSAAVPPLVRAVPSPHSAA